jgi:hypothetical protein
MARKKIGGGRCVSTVALCDLYITIYIRKMKLQSDQRWDAWLEIQVKNELCSLIKVKGRKRVMNE